ncbi:MAG: aminoacetone oxidase family FAD-binding enzyme, partial [bacterium]|nr:aminoacetone oxidase family FAD-binding enzyme [bacterium]
ALHRYLIQNNVQIEFNTRVSQMVVNANQVTAVKTDEGRLFPADAVILCTGGKSYTGTGSTGDGFRFAQELGVKVNPLHPALVPVEVAESWVKKLQGVTLQKVCLTILYNDQIIGRYPGDLVFTHFGISGPAVLDCSELIGELLLKGHVSVSIDLLPQFSAEQLDSSLQLHFRKYPSREIQNALVDFLPKKLALMLMQRAKISPQKPVNQLAKSERILLGKTIKDLHVTVTQLRPLEEAMITAGGIAISEINPKTMESNRIQGLYYAGEVIDLTGKSGGYNLQMAFSTGYLAGLNAAKRIF